MDGLDGLRKKMAAVRTLYGGRERIIWSNGCFDLFHAGHALGLSGLKNQLLLSPEFQEYRKAPGNEEIELLLFVGVNSNASVRRLKGPGRPVIPLEDRMDIVQSIKGVDGVIVFHGDDPGPEIEIVQPIWIAKDEDYRGKTVVGEEIAKKNGGWVIFIPRLGKITSSSDILRKIRGEYSPEFTGLDGIAI